MYASPETCITVIDKHCSTGVNVVASQNCLNIRLNILCTVLLTRYKFKFNSLTSLVKRFCTIGERHIVDKIH